MVFRISVKRLPVVVALIASFGRTTGTLFSDVQWMGVKATATPTTAWILSPPLRSPLATTRHRQFTTLGWVGRTATATTTATATDDHEVWCNQPTNDDSIQNAAASDGGFAISAHRRSLFQRIPTAAAAWMMVPQLEANALVKGVSPPPPKASTASGDRLKCTNVDECQAAAELREQQEREFQQANQVPALVAAKGTRYRDIEIGNAVVPNDNRVVQMNDDVVVYYKVLKLGKRSYDGLSGEGTVVFSRGYGYEDDERQPRDKAWTTTVGAMGNIAAFNDAVLGMRVAGIRRLVVLPDQGWRKPGRQCDGGPGGAGAGGDLKTDYVVVPTATMVATEACLDASKQPYPSSFAQQRRMAQRFDQSLILEVEVVAILPPGSAGDSRL